MELSETIVISLVLLTTTIIILLRRRIKLKYFDIQQYFLKNKVQFGKDSFAKVQYVGGIDISFVKNDDVNACISLVVVDLDTIEPVYTHTELIKMTCEYIPGYLAFRETPHIRKALKHIRKTAPHLYPDVLMVDGNGRLHGKQFGLACHTGVVCDIPAIGVAKNLYQMDSCLRDNEHMESIKNLTAPGDYFDVQNVEGTVIGCAVKSSKGSTKPVYVSEGHRISLRSARDIVMKCCRYRVPEPVRLADISSREVLRKLDE